MDLLVASKMTEAQVLKHHTVVFFNSFADACPTLLLRDDRPLGGRKLNLPARYVVLTPVILC
jgi:hypothetical protein